MSAKKQKLKQLSKEDADNLLERSKYSLELVNAWINNADTKVGISCAIMTFIFGIIAFVAENLLFEKNFEGEPNGTLMVCFKASMSVAVILFILFLLFHFLAIKPRLFLEKHQKEEKATFATVYKGNIIKNLIMDCQSYTKYRPNETTGGIFVSWQRKEELPTGA